jgi:hypothetical protein
VSFCQANSIFVFLTNKYTTVIEDFSSNSDHDNDDDVCARLESLNRSFEDNSYNIFQIDWAVEHGVSQKLVQSLRETILVRQNKQSATPSFLDDSSQEQTSIEFESIQPLESKSRIIYVSLLCVLLNGILNCTQTALENAIDDIEWELTESIVHLLKVLPMSDVVEDKLKCIVVGSALQIVQKCTKLFGRTHLVMIINEILQLVNDCSYFLPTELMIKMACTISYMFRIRYWDYTEKFRWKIQDSGTRLLDILSTISIVSMPTKITKEALYGLSNLAETHEMSQTVLQNQCAILTITTYIRSEDDEIQRTALDICQCLLLFFHPIDFWDSKDRSIIKENLALLQKVLIDSLLKTSDTSIQRMIVFILSDLQSKPDRDCNEKIEVMDALYHIADNTYEIGIAEVAGTSFLSCAGKFQLNDELLSKIATFLSMDCKFSFTARHTALWLLQDICTLNDNDAFRVANHSKTLSKLAKIICNEDSDEDCLDAIKICRQLVLSERNHKGMCKEIKLLKSLVQLAITKPIKNRKAHAISVEILVTLLSKQELVNCFVKLPQLLPWLVTLANRTCDDELKTSLIVAIRNLTTAIINKAHEV